MVAGGSVFGRALDRALRGAAILVCVLVAAALIGSKFSSRTAEASRNVDAPRAALADADDAPARPADTTQKVVRLDLQAQQQGGITTAEPKRTVYRRLVRGYGLVLSADGLTTLYNESLVQATQLRAAEAKATASRTANGRAEELLKVFPTNKAQAEVASATATADSIAADAVRTQMATLRNTAIDRWGPVLGEAAVSRAPVVADLVLRKLYLIQLTLESGDRTDPPPRILFTTDTGATTSGRFVAEAAQVDPRLQGRAYLYAAPAVPALLPGRSLIAEVPTGGDAPGVDIPSSAVVWQAGKPWIYLRTGADAFERTQVDDAVPAPDGGYVLPSRRVGTGDLVVAGAQVLLSQELKAQIPSDEDDN